MRKKTHSTKDIVSRLCRKNSSAGVALFMVMAAITLLAVLVAELTYSTQVSARMAYNHVDNIRVYYTLKAAFKLSLLRLIAYKHVKKQNPQILDAVGPDLINKIWSMPFLYPLPIPKEASEIEKDTVKKFLKESHLLGSYTAAITGESNKFNLNNLFIKEIPKPQAQNPTPPTPGTPTPNPQSPTPPEKVDFTPALEDVIAVLLDQKKREDKDFEDTYRHVEAKDIVTAIKYYIEKESPSSNLPGFKVFTPKLAPFYSLSELHLIPGIDDELYNLIEPALTVYATPGININKAEKKVFKALFPQLEDSELDDILRKRDDPDVGKPWKNVDEFWQSLNSSSVGRDLSSAKEKLKKANINLITDEMSFKISVQANYGLATRRLEAYVVLEPEKPKTNTPPPTGGTPPGVNVAGQPPQDKTSEKKQTGLNLIYWQVY